MTTAKKKGISTRIRQQMKSVTMDSLTAALVVLLITQCFGVPAQAATPQVEQVKIALAEEEVLLKVEAKAQIGERLIMAADFSPSYGTQRSALLGIQESQSEELLD